jgi:uncharacterized membrane protein YfcA
MLVVGIAAIAGAITHARAGRAELKTGAVFGLLGIAGSYAGSLASAAVPAGVLLAGFGVLMLSVAATMVIRHRIPALACPGRSSRSGTRHMAVVAAAATTVGLTTGFFGVGAGFVVVPALVLALGSTCQPPQAPPWSSSPSTAPPPWQPGQATPSSPSTGPWLAPSPRPRCSPPWPGPA